MLFFNLKIESNVYVFAVIYFYIKNKYKYSNRIVGTVIKMIGKPKYGKASRMFPSYNINMSKVELGLE